MGKLFEVQFDDNKLPYIDLGSKVIRMDREEAPLWALEKAAVELRETPEIKAKAIEELREMLKSK